MIPAMIRGTTKYFMGFAAMTERASICSVTRIVPSSAAMAEPARAVTISDVSTGPSSLVIPNATVEPTRLSALNMLNP